MADPELLLYSIAINAYDRSPLRGCVQDQTNMVAALEPLGFECHTLTDRDATLAHMEDFIAEGVSRTGPRGLLVLHDSGHGGQIPSRTEPDRTDECWFACDLSPLVDNRVGELLGQVDQDGQVLVIADSCFSQTITRAAPLGVEDAGDSFRKARLYVPEGLDLTGRRPKRGRDRALARAARSAPIVELAACRDTQVTYDAQINGVTQGCFTRAALDAWRDLFYPETANPQVLQSLLAAGEGPTIGAWYRQIRTKLPSEDYDNEPQLLASAGRRRWLALTADRRR
jgi:hypothetical protein